MLYRMVLRVLFMFPPEMIHRWTFAVLRFCAGRKFPGRLLSGWLGASDPMLRSTVFGVDFPAPLGLAAGFDKDGTGIGAWGGLGFGFAEIGTVTAAAQPGNPLPRLFRLPADRALVNRMGFNNAGAAAAAAQLDGTQVRRIPIGANIGKTKVVAAQDAPADYATSARLLGGKADYLVVNVSSPNTPGLRDLQAVTSLRPVLRAVLEQVDIPVLVKIAPDLSDTDIDAVADLAVELGLAGIVATNTTISRTGLASDPERVAAIGAGGLSGPPVADRSLAVLRRLYARVGDQVVLISVGGIESADQAWERIRAGASLLQGYTGFIYGGPFWMRRMHREIARRLRAGGYRDLSAAVGSAQRT